MPKLVIAQLNHLASLYLAVIDSVKTSVRIVIFTLIILIVLESLSFFYWVKTVLSSKLNIHRPVINLIWNSKNLLSLLFYVCCAIPRFKDLLKKRNHFSSTGFIRLKAERSQGVSWVVCKTLMLFRLHYLLFLHESDKFFPPLVQYLPIMSGLSRSEYLIGLNCCHCHFHFEAGLRMDLLALTFPLQLS